jgi:hypothetical protein
MVHLYYTYYKAVILLKNYKAMSAYKTFKMIKSELDKLNHRIDLKIIQGVPYYNEAKRHKFLRSQPQGLTLRKNPLFRSSLKFASLFMF